MRGVLGAAVPSHIPEPVAPISFKGEEADSGSKDGQGAQEQNGKGTGSSKKGK